jgi:hypothetical protein
LAAVLSALKFERGRYHLSPLPEADARLFRDMRPNVLVDGNPKPLGYLEEQFGLCPILADFWKTNLHRMRVVLPGKPLPWKPDVPDLQGDPTKPPKATSHAILKPCSMVDEICVKALQHLESGNTSSTRAEIMKLQELLKARLIPKSFEHVKEYVS